MLAGYQPLEPPAASGIAEGNSKLSFELPAILLKSSLNSRRFLSVRLTGIVENTPDSPGGWRCINKG